MDSRPSPVGGQKLHGAVNLAPDPVGQIEGASEYCRKYLYITMEGVSLQRQDPDETLLVQ
jgi:hypothetical protein